MKTNIRIISLFLMLYTLTCITPTKVSAQVSVSYQVFYDDLSPYGQWVNYSNYGYVWVPDVASGFTPYATNGYWLYSEDGWVWVSNYSWGWAPFHYGRWHTDAIYGPIWIPGYEWGPGWVDWRRSDGYYGWAPMDPYYNGHNMPNNQWTFVNNEHFGGHDINNYYIDNSKNVTIINNSTVINNTHIDKSHNVKYNAGPDRAEVEKRTGKKVSPVTIKESSKHSQNLSKNELEIYKPQVQKNTSKGVIPAPSKVANIKDVKTAAQRNNGNSNQKAIQPAKQAQTQQVKDNKPNNQKQQTQSPKTNPANKKQQSPPQKTNPTYKQPQSQPQKTKPTTKQPQSQPQKVSQPNKPQQVQPQKNNQPNKQQQVQPQKNNQPNKQQPAQPQKTIPTNKQEANPQKSNQQTSPQKSVPQNTGQPTKTQQPEPTKQKPI